MLTTVRDVQIPLLAVMLLGGCAAKAWRALRSGSWALRSGSWALRSGSWAPAGARIQAGAGSGPGSLSRLRLRRPVVIMTVVTELGLGLGLIATSGRVGAGSAASVSLPGTIVRAGTALFFLVAVGTLNELRQRRPAAGCGCFGELSDTPIGLRAIARAGLLCASAAATIGLPPLQMPSSPAKAELWLAVLAFELALIAFLSPELGEILVRLGYSEPCELRRVPVARTLAALRASPQWRRYASQVSAAVPADVWRERCWRFVVYPGTARGRRVDIVFAVYLQARRPVIRAAILDPDTEEVLAPTTPRESAAL